jgi:hypothetical protein
MLRDVKGKYVSPKGNDSKTEELLSKPKRQRGRVVDNRTNPFKFVLKLNDVYLGKAFLMKAIDMGLIVDKDNFDRLPGTCISIGTSKHFDVAGNNNPDFYLKKRNITPVELEPGVWETFCELLESFADAKHPVSISGGEVNVKFDSKQIELSSDISTISYDDLKALYEAAQKAGKI